MKEIILVKYGEIILKGGNRPRFEKILMNNIRDAVKNIDDIKMHMAQATIYITPSDEEKIDIICERLSLIFGIVSVTRAGVCEKDIEEIPQEVKDAVEIIPVSNIKQVLDIALVR